MIAYAMYMYRFPEKLARSARTLSDEMAISCYPFGLDEYQSTLYFAGFEP